MLKIMRLFAKCGANTTRNDRAAESRMKINKHVRYKLDLDFHAWPVVAWIDRSQNRRERKFLRKPSLSS